MNVDHHFWIGKTHKVCEDYAISGRKGDITYAILCDGCSSSRDTDFGARILARAALEHIDSCTDLHLLSKLVISTAKAQALALGLGLRSLDATLLMAVCVDDTIYINMLGDGAFAVKYKGSDEIVKVKADYPESAPYYVSYLLNSYQNECFLNELPKGYNPYTIISNSIKVISPDKYWPWYQLQCQKENIEFVAIASDGVDSFQKQENTETSITSSSVPFDEVLNKLLSFKNFKGEFVKRRSNRAMKEMSKEGYYHNDDVSLAVLYNED